MKAEAEGKAFFLNLIECLPSAQNLRDLRYFSAIFLIFIYAVILLANISTLVNSIKDWLGQDKIDLPIFFKDLIRCCPNLEKLSLYVPKEGWEHNSAIDCSQIQESILSFVKRMGHLVHLSLSYFPFDVTVIQEQLIKEILPSRPAFWASLSPSVEIAKTNDLSVSSIHYDGVNFIDLGDPYYFPPRFL